MKKTRIIARLDIKGQNVIKGIQFECLRVMGQPGEMAKCYYEQGADEIIYLDTVANLYQRNNLIHIVNRSSENIFVPLTVGGGVRSVNDIRELLQAGADKVAINTAATKNMYLIREAANMFGSQCIVVSIEAKRVGSGKWEAYVDNGRQRTGLDVVEWAKKVEGFGAGEILLTSVDMDGTERGFDLELVKAVSNAVSISLVVSGGAGSPSDISKCISSGKIDGIACGSILHYNKYHISGIKRELLNDNVSVRIDLNAKGVVTEPGQKYDITDYNKFTLSHIQSGDDGIDDGDKVLNVITKWCDGNDDYEIGIINCGINNVKSILKAFEIIGKKAKIIDTPKEVLFSRYLVLPGVGAFECGMNKLQKMNLVRPIRDMVKKGTPLLGICLGMQLLFSESEEFGLHKGLGIIEGRVVPFKDQREVNLEEYKVPHIGWNEIKYPSFMKNIVSWENTVLRDTEECSDVYFVHSFYCIPSGLSDIVATAEYGGQEFCAVIKCGNVTAMQFHPEKSGSMGLKMLEVFCSEGSKNLIK